MIFQTKARAIKYLESNGYQPIEDNTRFYIKPGYYKVPKGCLTRPYYKLEKRASNWRVYRNYSLLNGVEMKEMVHSRDKI